MKKLFLSFLLVTGMAQAESKKEYLVDSGSSGYHVATNESEGPNAVMELKDTLGKTYLVPKSECKIVGESVEAIGNLKVEDKVLYSYDYYESGTVVSKAVIKKLFSNNMALIDVREYQNNGHHPYVFTRLSRLSLKQATNK